VTGGTVASFLGPFVVVTTVAGRDSGLMVPDARRCRALTIEGLDPHRRFQTLTTLDVVPA